MDGQVEPPWPASVYGEAPAPHPMVASLDRSRQSAPPTWRDSGFGGSPPPTWRDSGFGIRETRCALRLPRSRLQQRTGREQNARGETGQQLACRRARSCTSAWMRTARVTRARGATDCGEAAAKRSAAPGNRPCRAFRCHFAPNRVPSMPATSSRQGVSHDVNSSSATLPPFSHPNREGVSP